MHPRLTLSLTCGRGRVHYEGSATLTTRQREVMTTDSITHRTQSDEACDVPLPTTETRHIVAKVHKPLAKTHVWSKENKRPIFTVTHIYTHTYTHVSNYSQFFILFTSANYGHIDSIDFPNMYTRTHGRTNHFWSNWL